MAVTYCSTKNESKAFCNLTISKANPLTKRQKNVVKLLQFTVFENKYPQNISHLNFHAKDQI